MWHGVICPSLIRQFQPGASCLCCWKPVPSTMAGASLQGSRMGKGYPQYPPIMNVCGSKTPMNRRNCLFLFISSQAAINVWQFEQWEVRRWWEALRSYDTFGVAYFQTSPCDWNTWHWVYLLFAYAHTHTCRQLSIYVYIYMYVSICTYKWKLNHRHGFSSVEITSRFVFHVLINNTAAIHLADQESNFRWHACSSAWCPRPSRH